MLQIELMAGGLTAHVLTWGATLQGLWMDGIAHSLVRGSPDVRAYFGTLRYFGAIVGPVANRIAGAAIIFDGCHIALDANEDGRTTLHGGTRGFGERSWRLLEHHADRCTLALDHADGLCGFPGPLHVDATYRLEANAMTVAISARAEAPALFAPAFHGYWTLDGAPDLSGHLLQIDAETFLPVDTAQIPLGRPETVAGTPFDHRAPRQPDRDIDHNFCLSENRGPLRRAARLTAGGLVMELETTEPGLQVYASGRTSSGTWAGHEGAPFGRYAGLALEPQVWPDAPNRPYFPSARIEAGETITQVTRFAFSRRG